MKWTQRNMLRLAVCSGQEYNCSAYRRDMGAAWQRRRNIPNRTGGQVDNVIVVHITVGPNRELRFITSPHYRKFSRDLYELWPTLLLMPDEFWYIPTEQLFRYVPTDSHPELEPWVRYMKSRYSFLK